MRLKYLLNPISLYRIARANLQWRKSYSDIEKRNGKNWAITRIWIDESQNECDMCGVCEVVAPEVFSVPIKAVVNPNADLAKNRKKTVEASHNCPVSVIAVEINNKEVFYY